MSQQSLVLQGSLDDTSVDEVLSTISLSRVCLRVEFDDEESSIVVKAGNVLRATGAESPAGLPAFHALRRRHAGGFRVYRQPFSAQNGEPIIGTLSQLLGAQSEASSPPGEQLILAGTAADGGLLDVLGIMSLSRQRLELRVYRADGSVGRLVSKAGLVVQASIEPGGLEERTALLALMRVPPVRFELSRVAEEGRLPRPFGSLAELRPAGAQPRDAGRRHRSVIRGDFDEYGFLDVLTIVTASRQVLEITLTRRGEWRGMLLVKAGQLLDARTEGGDVGVRALYALIADPGDSFDAVLSQRARLPATPLGDLRTLTTAAVAQGAQLREITDQGTDDAVAPPSSVPPTPPPSPVIAARSAGRPPEPPTVTDEEVTAIGPPPVLPVSPTAAELTHMARGIGRIEQQLARQDVLLERAVSRGEASAPSAGSSRGLILGVLAAQLVVGALLVVLIGLLV